MKKVNFNSDKKTVQVTLSVRDRNYAGYPQDLGVKDSKGREIGAIIQTFMEEYRLMTPEENARLEEHGGSFSSVEPGTFYAVVCQATRNDKVFGAAQSRNLFFSKADRDAHILRYLADAKKRAAKNAVA